MNLKHKRCAIQSVYCVQQFFSVLNKYKPCAEWPRTLCLTPRKTGIVIVPETLKLQLLPATWSYSVMEIFSHVTLALIAAKPLADGVGHDATEWEFVSQCCRVYMYVHDHEGEGPGMSKFIHVCTDPLVLHVCIVAGSCRASAAWCTLSWCGLTNHYLQLHDSTHWEFPPPQTDSIIMMACLIHTCYRYSHLTHYITLWYKQCSWMVCQF